MLKASSKATAVYSNSVHKQWLSMWRWAHREHEEGVEHESHRREGLDGGHHVPLQTQREHDEQRHSDQQQHAKTARHL